MVSPLVKFATFEFVTYIFVSLPIGKFLACVASVSARFRSRERGTRVKDRAKNGEKSFHFSRGQNRSFFAPKPNGNACYAG